MFRIATPCTEPFLSVTAQSKTWGIFVVWHFLYSVNLIFQNFFSPRVCMEAALANPTFSLQSSSAVLHLPAPAVLMTLTQKSLNFCLWLSVPCVQAESVRWGNGASAMKVVRPIFICLVPRPDIRYRYRNFFSSVANLVLNWQF